MRPSISTTRVSTAQINSSWPHHSCTAEAVEHCPGALRGGVCPGAVGATGVCVCVGRGRVMVIWGAWTLCMHALIYPGGASTGVCVLRGIRAQSEYGRMCEAVRSHRAVQTY